MNNHVQYHVCLDEGGLCNQNGKAPVQITSYYSKNKIKIKTK